MLTHCRRTIALVCPRPRRSAGTADGPEDSRCCLARCRQDERPRSRYPSVEVVRCRVVAHLRASYVCSQLRPAIEFTSRRS